MIYLDHNATAPLDPRVLEAMLPWLREAHGNPSSVHSAGQRARAAVDEARERVAAALGAAPREIVFTSGGTEADNLALRGVHRARPGRVVVSAVEHLAVLETARGLGTQAFEIAVNSDGALDWDGLEAAVGEGTSVVSVQWANNETGVLFPVERIGALCRARGVPFHVDAVQAAGRVPLALGARPIDLASVSGHKVHGPKGVGALYVRKGTPLASVLTGGHQERGRRAGTENVAGIVGFGVALELAAAELAEGQRCQEGLRDRLQARLAALAGAVVIGGERARLANTLSIGFAGVEAEALLMGLDLEGICASAGSACTSGSLEISHVLKAMRVPEPVARGAVRFSLGRGTTEAEIDRVAEVVPRLVAALRR
jgi:cysteine desulfurase